jgi:prepilin-type N-terminal cleavage/methylation domain-containing protein
MNKERGFTLIELLIVLAILGILVGIVAMSVGDINSTAKRRGMQSEYEIVQTAIDTYLTQDVTVGGATIPTGTLSNDTTATKIKDATAYDFDKYLRRASKYYYLWSDLSVTSGYTLTVLDATTAAAAEYEFNGAWVKP